MKRVLYLLPVLFLLMSACGKESNKEPEIVICLENPAALEGKWYISATWNSPGTGDIVWTPVTHITDSISFAKNGTFSSTEYPSANRFIITPSLNVQDTMLKIYKEGGTDTIPFIIELSPHTLTLHSFRCIEGCSTQYTDQVFITK